MRKGNKTYFVIYVDGADIYNCWGGHSLVTYLDMVD